jgi:ubiquinone/menaquinone biosynthesis C-methylase UbiE
VNSTWLFNFGADVYAWFTAQAAWRSSCQRLASRLTDLPTNATILDLGCGPGVSTFELARSLPGARLIGVDVAPRMLGQARNRHKAAHLQQAASIQWLRADAACLPIKPASVDACAGHSFLYLVRNREQVLAEARRTLRPGGRLVLMEPNQKPASVRRTLGISHDLRHLVSVSLWRPFSRLHGRFTTESLQATLARAGFIDCRVEETLGGLGLLGYASAPP